MNAAVNHIMQTTDWTKYSLEEWLYQFGAWMYSNSGTCGKSINPIAVAMDQAAKKRKQEVKGKEQIMVDWLCSDDPVIPKGRGRITCEITDNEARAVQRLILDMQGQSEVLDEWLDAVIKRYFYNNSWSEMVVTQMNPVGDMVVVYSQNDARADVKCGLAAIHCRYSFIKYK
ncbi:hypothetical protein D3X56_05520 [Acinetobacter baumannii]|uniref:hypothetical protein n=1 Tax=Acinetobacter baumannii TaxID=470 RepID=UPI000E69B09B|nr:hypothetical protein [Acinetobacter baumannii]RIW63764.1 hypothetical protein D3X24_07860 [Acinetobacter baumannii]RIX05929.1 hypothetical protein D3X41_08190 [Acinetobacter baumannii]RIX20788.1 hypothetical protein D3X39_12410 [Acinetobacter baumannii]RIX21067.1 hypothetical protein D3X69_01750 [Acinetobacter baumannii]RIX33624.1 hypothetical protein D3X60_07585 [Acinetobacter baumannii]